MLEKAKEEERIQRQIEEVRAARAQAAIDDSSSEEEMKEPERPDIGAVALNYMSNR